MQSEDFKKTLLGIAFGEKYAAIWKQAKESIPGQLAVVFGVQDEISPSKISVRFSAKSENVKVLGGIFENRFIGKAEIIELSKLPSKEELLAKLVGSIASPMSGFARVLSGNIRGLLQVLSAIKN